MDNNSLATQAVILVPAYKPTLSLIDLIKNLRLQRPNQRIIVVDDGSGEEFQMIFAELKSYQVDLLKHSHNLGKGAALKTGLKHWLTTEIYSNSVGIVTADADGQHSASDIIKLTYTIAEQPSKLHIGVREFSQKRIPFRSKFGNILTRFIMTQVSKIEFQDTQSGLRGIPLELIKMLVNTPTNGYDFELEMLMLSTSNHIHINEIKISTIYFDDNKTSHFNAVSDSLKIYFVFLRYAGISILAAAVDLSVFYAVFTNTSHILIAVLCGRLISGMFNYSLNKKIAFRDKSGVVLSGIKYFTLAVLIILTSYLLTKYFYNFGVPILISKIIAETILYFINFFIQRKLIFKQK